MQATNAVPDLNSSYPAATSVELNVSRHAHATSGVTPTVTVHLVADHHYVQHKQDIAAIVHQPDKKSQQQQQFNQIKRIMIALRLYATIGTTKTCSTLPSFRQQALHDKFVNKKGIPCCCRTIFYCLIHS